MSDEPLPSLRRQALTKIHPEALVDHEAILSDLGQEPLPLERDEGLCIDRRLSQEPPWRNRDLIEGGELQTASLGLRERGLDLLRDVRLDRAKRLCTFLRRPCACEEPQEERIPAARLYEAPAKRGREAGVRKDELAALRVQPGQGKLDDGAIHRDLPPAVERRHVPGEDKPGGSLLASKRTLEEGEEHERLVRGVLRVVEYDQGGRSREVRGEGLLQRAQVLRPPPDKEAMKLGPAHRSKERRQAGPEVRRRIPRPDLAPEEGSFSAERFADLPAERRLSDSRHARDDDEAQRLEGVCDLRKLPFSAVESLDRGCLLGEVDDPRLRDLGDLEKVPERSELIDKFGEGCAPPVLVVNPRERDLLDVAAAPTERYGLLEKRIPQARDLGPSLRGEEVHLPAALLLLDVARPFIDEGVCDQRPDVLRHVVHTDADGVRDRLLCHLDGRFKRLRVFVEVEQVKLDSILYREFGTWHRPPYPPNPSDLGLDKN